MIAAADNPLVTGGAPSGAQKVIRVRVLRPFLLRTERQEVDTVLEVPRALAWELISANKAERTDAPTAAEVKAAAKASAKTPPAKTTPEKEA